MQPPKAIAQKKMAVVDGPELAPSEIIADRSSNRDVNGNLAAGLQIKTNLSGLTFKANSGIIKITNFNGWYLLFLSPEETTVKVFRDGYFPLKISLPAEGIDLKEGQVWRITLKDDQYMSEEDLNKYISDKVNQKINAWQKKGKYESTKAYKKRVTEEKRQALVNTYSQQVLNSLGRSVFNTNIASTKYDADSETFKLIFADKSQPSLYLPVPVEEAPAFDQNLDRLQFNNMDFILDEAGKVAISSATIVNPTNNKSYRYDSGQNLTFNSAELALNFDPIKVNVDARKSTPSVREGTKKIEVGKADVDINIPETNMTNNDAIAVVIGNRSYQGDTPDVDYAVNDAQIVKEYLVKTLGFKPGNILYEENASKSRMEVLLGDDDNPGRLANYLKPDKSDVFFFYSGHGAPDPNTKTGYLMPVDADASALAITGYPLDVLYDNLGELNAKSISVVIDACFSGATGGGGMLVQNASPIGIEVKNPAAQLDNGFVVTASSGSQVASWYPEKGHGLLTYFWLKGLQGAADANNDRKVTTGEIKQYLTDATDGLPYWARRLHNRQQMPQVYGNDGEVLVTY